MLADPGIMKMFRVDRGAIKFVLAGANIMCPGLTSAGGGLDVEVPAEAPVVKTSSCIWSLKWKVVTSSSPIFSSYSANIYELWDREACVTCETLFI